MLSSIEKAAIIIKAIGEENMAAIMQFMKKENAEKIMEILKALNNVSPEEEKSVLREALKKSALIKTQAVEERLNKYFDLKDEDGEDNEIDIASFLERSDHRQLLELIKNEHPQVIAFILSYIPSEISGKIIPLLAPDQQKDVAYRIATMEIPQKNMFRHLNTMLGNKIKIFTRKTKDIGGVEGLVKILRGVGRNCEQNILEHFREANPELASKIKDLMFVFEDLILLDSQSIQKVLREIDMKTLAKALKKTNPEIKELILKNLSERARTVLLEDIESLGMIPVREVDKAQQRVVEIVKQLEEKGEISINKEQEEFV